METGEQYTDLMELYILELKKLPPEDQNKNGIIRWMRFLGGKNREEYEQRQKAIRDYNSQMKSAERRGEKRGEERGIRIGKKQMMKRLIGENAAEGVSQCNSYLVH